MGDSPIRLAPGRPGIEPRWTTSAKCAVGTAYGVGTRVWFTASHGILNEVYYPEVDTACLRDAGFLVAAADGYRSEEKRDARHAVEWLAPGVPAFRLTNRGPEDRYEITKRVCCSPDYDAVLQHVRFEALRGSLADYRLVFLLAPHLGNRGVGNTGWRGEHKGVPLLLAARERWALAVACDAGWAQRTAGYAGDQDAWHDVQAHGRLTATYDRAEDGNVALAASVDLVACGGRFTIALAFGPDPDTAAAHARAALFEPYDLTEERYAREWRAWQRSLLDLDEACVEPRRRLYRPSTAVLRTHLTTNTDGGVIASLSLPWGDTQGDGDLGGYHLVWPRDMVETAGGFLAAGAVDAVRPVLRFLATTQETDGHWPQNMWLSGAPFWHGVQLDETALPVLLVDLARRKRALARGDEERLWPMVRRAAAFLVRRGPATDQDRWEEDSGYSPFTLAVTVAALLAAADLAARRGETGLAQALRDTADDWNDGVERWTWVEGTPLAERVGVRGYYVRIGSEDAVVPALGRVPVRNRPAGQAEVEAWALVSADALALVRFGLRAPDDPRILDTVRVIDALLRVETATGPAWRRYNGDGYGEHDDGTAFDGTGVGRAWPLLAGERAHYELAAGRREEAERLAATLRAQANEGNLLPEQVWDGADVPERELRNGGPTGSAMPLVWAHAEYVKLLRSLRDGDLFDRPPQTLARYARGGGVPRVTTWHPAWRRRSLVQGRLLRIDAEAPFRVRWTRDGWASFADAEAREHAPALFCAELPTADLPVGASVTFTLHWTRDDRWEGGNHTVEVVAPSRDGTG